MISYYDSLVVNSEGALNVVIEVIGIEAGFDFGSIGIGIGDSGK